MFKSKYSRVLLFILIILIYLPSLFAHSIDSQKSVYVISIDGEITPAMSSFMKNAIDDANSNNADGIIIQISTLGGRVDSAIEMRDQIIGSSADVAVYISTRAISAGALISIAAQTIAMAPGSHIGAAEPVPNEPKSLAFVSGEFRSTADRTGRDPDIAMAMVDSSIEIDGLVKKGEILDLTANQALELEYADFIANNIEEVLDKMGWSDANIIEKSPDFRYRIAHFLTSYEVASILLTLGMLGIIAEFFTQGFGLTGIVGISCFALYFAGGFLAGTTDLWAIFIFIAGLVLLIIELLVPGFGIFGISGIIALFTSLVVSAPTIRQGVISLSIAMLATTIAIPVFLKYFGRSRFMERLVLSTSETTASGYVHATSRDSLLGKEGTAQSVLRPSGSIIINSEKIDAIANGDYIEKGVKVIVIKVEGSKVIVRAKDE